MKEKELEKLLKALGNKRRLEIVRYLKANKEKSVGDIAKKINLSFRSTSRHLLVLYGNEILDKRQSALQVFYKISVDIPKIAINIISSIV